MSEPPKNFVRSLGLLPEPMIRGSGKVTLRYYLKVLFSYNCNCLEIVLCAVAIPSFDEY
jgi:hypothetical protein